MQDIPMTDSHLEIVTLPVDAWQQYRALRLRALKEDPEAFSSSYADALALPEERWKARLRDALQSERSWLYFARMGGRLAGMIGAFVEESAPETATIVSVYVPAEERGKGISRELMECMLKELSANRALKAVTLTVNKAQLPAVALYKKFGFQQTGSQSAEMGNGEVAEEIVMERPLPY